MKKLSQQEALELAVNTLQKNGALKENALPLALGIIDAENQGIKSHGFHYLPIYCLHLKCKKVKGPASPKLNAISNVAFKLMQIMDSLIEQYLWVWKNSYLRLKKMELVHLP